MLNYAPRADEELWPCAIAPEPNRPGTMAAHSTLRSLTAMIRDALERRQAIAELEGLDDRLLKDMGLARGEIRHAVSGERIASGSRATKEDRQ